MAIIINGIDADDSVRKDFTVVSVTFSDSFKVDYVGDGVHEIQVLCDYTTPTPPYETPTLTPSVVPPTHTPPPLPTEEPMSWYCVSLSDYPEPDCAGSPEVTVVCQQGIDIDWQTVGDCFNLGDTSYVVDVVGGPYETRVNCEAACIITPTPTPSTTPVVPGCCLGELTSNPFATEEDAQAYASSHGVEYAGCQDLKGCPDCDVDDQGCVYYFSDVVEIAGSWYVKYTLSTNNCHPCTPTPTISATPEPTIVPPPLWYCYEYDDNATVEPTPSLTPSCLCGGTQNGVEYCAGCWGGWTTQEAAEAYVAVQPTVSFPCGGGMHPFCEGTTCVLGYTRTQLDPSSNTWIIVYCEVVYANCEGG